MQEPAHDLLIPHKASRPSPDAAPILSTARPHRREPIIRIPALGLTVRVRFGCERDGQEVSVIETTHAAGFGPPLHRRAESEIFEIVAGRFLFEVDGRRFVARRGDLVRVPAGAARAYVNVTGTGARQQITIQPGFDAASFYAELAELLTAEAQSLESLRRFGKRWDIVVLGAPLDAAFDAFDA
ncbi:cupin domain-containing protein [Variovorax robiniae]|uniref:Cupin domain-containing protein n=1 Tax=Variovorax robiniae TaxID=1836199 RepID=A0ABU8X6U4_9BURK